MDERLRSLRHLRVTPINRDKTPSWLRHSVSVPDLLSKSIINNMKHIKNIGFTIACSIFNLQF
jgi:hypothetical protein